MLVQDFVGKIVYFVGAANRVASLTTAENKSNADLQQKVEDQCKAAKKHRTGE